MLDKLISPAAEKAFGTLRRTGFVGGLTREVAAEVAEEACSDEFDFPHYIEQGADDDGGHCVLARWAGMTPNAPKHFGA